VVYHGTQLCKELAKADVDRLLPHNWFQNGGSTPGRHGSHWDVVRLGGPKGGVAQAWEQTRELARLTGWLKEPTPTFGGVLKAAFPFPSMGMNSPRNPGVDVGNLAQTFRSPGRFNRLVGAAIYRANEHLSGFYPGEEVHVSWEAVRAALSAPRISTGVQRLGRRIAAQELRRKTGILLSRGHGSYTVTAWDGAVYEKEGTHQPDLRLYRGVVETMRDLHPAQRRAVRENLKVSTHTREEYEAEVARIRLFDTASSEEGVEVLKAGALAETHRGVTATPYIRMGKLDRQTNHGGWLVEVEGQMPYHAAAWAAASRAVREGVRAWRKQRHASREARRNHPHLAGWLMGEHGHTPVFWPADSYRAGNCEAGTAQWMREHLAGRPFAGGPELVAHLGDERVLRIIARRYAVEVENQAAA
jgi:hypothetical protein